MRANRKIRDQNAAEVGIGTMIVFIATVLVAAIAAGVLIDTSGKLQERSSRTGDQATKQVASNLHIERTMGTREGNGSTDQVRYLNVTLSLAPGASRVDLKQVKIQMSDGAKLLNFGWQSETAGGENSPDSTGFNVTEVRDADNSIANDLGTVDSGSAVMTSGDLVTIMINLHPTAGLNMPLDPRQAVMMTLVPEVGAQVHGDFTTPEAYGSDTWIAMD